MHNSCNQTTAPVTLFRHSKVTTYWPLCGVSNQSPITQRTELQQPCTRYACLSGMFWGGWLEGCEVRVSAEGPETPTAYNTRCDRHASTTYRSVFLHLLHRLLMHVKLMQHFLAQLVALLAVGRMVIRYHRHVAALHCLLYHLQMLVVCPSLHSEQPVVSTCSFGPMLAAVKQ